MSMFTCRLVARMTATLLSARALLALSKGIVPPQPMSTQFLLHSSGAGATSTPKVFDGVNRV